MKVLFLDVDGVLNSEVTYKKMYYRQGKFRGLNKIRRSEELEDKYLKNLSYVVKKTGCKIVLSSTWRIFAQSEPDHPLHRMLADYGMAIYDYTPRLHGLARGQEIQKWIDEHRDLNVTNIVILDDDSDMEHLMPYLVKTKFTNSNYRKWGRFALGLGEGLTRKKAREAISVLNKNFT